MIRAARSLLLAGISVLAPLALVASPAQAATDDEATIAHVERSGGDLRVLVNVPAGADIDLSAVTASLDGEDLDVTAEPAGGEAAVRRTAVLAIDTSASMRREGRFEAAKAAAVAYLDAVPADVEVGVVTFDSQVSTALEPTTDRGEAEAVIAGLDLSRDTLLYDGVIAAVDAAGVEGQRSVLVLSDGADTGSAAALADVASSIEEADALVDVVSLGQQGPALDALRQMTEAGNGQVISSDGDALAQTFASEADVLARQVLVTAPVPAGFHAEEATVAVRLTSSTTTLVASALARINDASGETTSSPPPSLSVPESESSAWQAPPWVLYVAFGALALGAIGLAVLLVPRPAAPMTIAERVAAYSSVTRGGGPVEEQQAASEPVLDQAKAAAAGVLDRHHGLNDRLTRRLTAAGSEFKPSEWLLVHVGVVLAAGLLGMLIGGGSIILGLLFLVPGVLAPPMYLSYKAGRRRKQFDTALPEVLQLLSGALSAGLSLAQAVDTVSSEGPQPIADEFKRVLVEARLGVGIEDAFDSVAERFQSKDFAWVVMAIRIQRQVGGNLAELLTTVSETMRERQYLRRQVNALAAEGKLSALILSALPPMVFLFVMWTRGDYMRPLFTTGVGLLMLIGGTIWLAIGIFWMSRLVKVEI